MTDGNSVVHLPTPEDSKQAEETSRTLSKYADVERVKLSISTDSGEKEDLILPGHVFQILLYTLSEMAKGNAISLVPHNQEIGTQEAANLLNVSRPHLVSLLEDGQIPFRKVGSHRRILLEDMLTYREKQYDLRSKTLDELGELSQKNDMGY